MVFGTMELSSLEMVQHRLNDKMIVGSDGGTEGKMMRA